MTKLRALKPELAAAALLALALLAAAPASLAQVPVAPSTTPNEAPAPSPAPAASGTDGAHDKATTAPPPPAVAATSGEGPALPSRAPATAEPSPLQLRIKAAADKASDLKDKVGTLRDRHTITTSQAEAYERQIASWVSMLSALNEQAALVEQEKEEAKTASVAQNYDKALNKQTALAEAGLSAINAQLTEVSSATGWNLIGTLLRARCATAICFDNGNKKDWLGIEPLVELPVGKSLALSKSSLSNYVDNHELRIDLAAGARVWLFRDILSVSIYISKPLTDGRIRLEGSPFVYPAASIRRPYPGIALGLLFDSLWLGFDRDELRNGDGQDTMAVNPDFPPNTAVSSTWTLTVALQPVTAFRTAIGTAVQATGRNGK